jgi:hypothetical protein
MKILYIGNLKPSTTSLHKREALIRLGNEVISIDPYEFLCTTLSNVLTSKLHYFTGYKLIQRKIVHWLQTKLDSETQDFDLVWIDSGELLGRDAIKYLNQKVAEKVILYNHDDPTGKRDGNRFKSLITAIPYYSVCVVVRDENVKEFYSLGAQQVIRVYRSYDEVEHAPFNDETEIPPNFKSDVTFIGTWMRDERRDIFLLKLIQAGINVTIWGNRWQKSAYWEQLKQHWKGPALSGRDYVAAIQGAKLCLGMLSKGNRDLHTTRSAEIPYSNGLLCAERTNEHQQMFEEGIEALFWKNADECISVCKKALTNDSYLQLIKSNGHKKIIELELGHEKVLSKIISITTKE